MVDCANYGTGMEQGTATQWNKTEQSLDQKVVLEKKESF